MFTKLRLATTLAALFLAFSVLADDADSSDNKSRVTASRGYLMTAPDGLDPERQTVPMGGENESLVADKYLADGVRASKPRTVVQRSHDAGDFWIYDAQASIYFDDDYDGFYAGLDVAFDADTVYTVADVYARVYLSYEGGPWILYYTTDVFTLLGTSADDDYVIETDLIEGYPTGYYDVLIELYDYDYDEFVAEFGPEESSSLSLLPLEDQTKDIGIVSPVVAPASHSHGGGGSAGLLALLGLSLVRLARTRKTRL